MSVCFNILDTKIEFHDDLKKYYDLSCEFQTVHDEILKSIKNDLESFKAPTDIFKTIESRTNKYIYNIINQLSNYGVLDIVISDYLDTNSGYLQLLNTTADYYEYSKSAEKRNNDIADESKKKTGNLFNSTITGLDFGVITNSIIGHAVYSSMNANEVHRQSMEALSRYSAACDAIDANRDKKTSLEIKEYYLNQYIPSITSALSVLFGQLLSTYAKDLNDCGYLDLECLKNIDFQRSNEIINNIENVDNKQGVFLKSIELCPYNVNAYIKGYSAYFYPQGLSITDICGDLLKYFNLEKALKSILIPVSSISNKAEECLNKGDYCKAKEFYEEITYIYPNKHIGWLGLLLCETQKFTNIIPDMNISETLYKKTIAVADDEKFCDKLISRFGKYKSDIEKYKMLLKEKEQLKLKEEENKKLIESTQKNCRSYLILTVSFGIISVMPFLLMILTDPTYIFFFLFVVAITAVLCSLYNNNRKMLIEYQKFNEKLSKSNEEISKLKNKIIGSTDANVLI